MAELNKNFSLLEVLDSSQIEGRGNASNCTVDSNFSSARLRAHSESVVSPQLSPNSVAINRKCDENELHVATLYCLTCATNLCQQCSEIIHSTNVSIYFDLFTSGLVPAIIVGARGVIVDNGYLWKSKYARLSFI